MQMIVQNRKTADGNGVVSNEKFQPNLDLLLAISQPVLFAQQVASAHAATAAVVPASHGGLTISFRAMVIKVCRDEFERAVICGQNITYFIPIAKILLAYW